MSPPSSTARAPWPIAVIVPATVTLPVTAPVARPTLLSPLTVIVPVLETLPV